MRVSLGVRGRVISFCVSTPTRTSLRDLVLQSWALLWGQVGRSCVGASGLLWSPVTNSSGAISICHGVLVMAPT